MLETLGGPVHVRVWRADASPAASTLRPVLFGVHGLTDSGEVFEVLWEALGRRWTVVAPDAPGHGQTPWAGKGRYSLTAGVDSFAGVIDALPQLVPGGDRVVLLGHSVGGLSAARLAALRPEPIRHLLIEEPPRRPLRALWEHRKHGAWIARLQAMDEAGRLDMAAENAGWQPREFGPWARSKAEVDRRIFDSASSWGPTLTELLADVRAPVTLLLGSRHRGSTSSGRRQRGYQRACSGGCELIYLDAGHNPRRDDPVTFARVIAATLNRYSK